MTIYPWQQAQWQKMLLALDKQRMPHALLLHGAVGSGKLDFANALAHKILCEDKTASIACGKCKSCKLLSAGSHPDFNLLSQELGLIIKVDDLRKIQEKLKLTPYLASNKIAIIYPAENMNASAANSLLKTLEEPAANSLIILVSNSPRKLLATIRSRCQQIFMPTPNLAEAADWLQTKSITTDAEILLNIAGGAPLLALEYDVSEDVDLYAQFVTDFYDLQQKKADPLRLSFKWDKSDFSKIIKWLMLLTTQIIKARMSSSMVDDTTITRLVNPATDMRRYFNYYTDLLIAKNLINSSVNKRLLLDNLFLKGQGL